MAADLVPTPCPLCLGPLQVEAPNTVACIEQGHRYDPESLSAAQRGHVMRALWNAVRALEDEAACADWIASTQPEQAVHQLPKSAKSFADSQQIRELIQAVDPWGDGR